MFKNSWKPKPMSTAAVATDYARKLVQREMRGPGDTDRALRRLEARYGINFWSLWHLWHRRAKSVDGDLLQQLRGAYLNLCERQIGELQTELAIEKALGGDDDDYSDLVAQAESLAKRIAEAKARRLTKRGRG